MSLESLRAEIDDLDRQIARLLQRRATVAQEIGAAKATTDKSVFDPGREERVYENVVAAAEGPLPAESIRAIWREVVSAHRALQRKSRIAYFGPAGTFTHQAARQKFGASVEFVAQKTIPDVFTAVASDRAEFGVVPIENSTEGPVNITADALAETSLKIVSELYLPIHLALLGKGTIADVKVVYSHGQPLAQAKRYLSTKLPNARPIESLSTVEAVEHAASEDGAAAIASELAVEGRDIQVLARNIEDTPDNETRFFVIAPRSAGRTGSDKTTMMVSIKDEVGALHSMLGTFREHGVNLTRIQSRPSRRRAWDYIFFLDCVGHVDDASVSATIAALESRSRHVQVLGSYPAAGRDQA